MPKQIDDNMVYQATVEALLAQGYAKATTKLIAALADISEVTLFRKYGSKAQLVAAAVNQHVFQPDESDIIYTGNVAADLLHIVQLYDRSSDKDSQLFPLLLSEIVRYPELRELLAGPLTSIIRVGELIARYQAEGALKAENPLHTMGGLLGPIILNKMLRNAAPEMSIPPVDFTAHIQSFLLGRSELKFDEN